MPTLNLRLTAILVISLMVVGGGVHLLHGFQVGRQAHALKIASETYEEDSKAAIKKAESATDPEVKKSARIEGEKDLFEAIRLLNDYVRLVPRDRGAEIHLGLLFIDARQLKPAFDRLEDALRSTDKSVPPVAPEDVRNARLRLAKDVAMKLGSLEAWQAAQAHLDILLEGTLDDNKRRKRNGQKPEGDAELLDLYAQALIYTRNEKEACEVLQDALSIAPDRVDTSLHLAGMMRSLLHQEPEADAVIESMIAKNPKSVPAYEKYVAYYLMTGKKDKIDKAYGKAKEL
jgi:tetratricopeptide (TPR) repeat protein